MRNGMYQLFIIIAWLPAVAAGATPAGLTGDRGRDVEIISDWLQSQAPPEGGQEAPSGEVIPPPPVVRVGGDANCGFSSIQAAIDAFSGPVEIHIARNASYSGQALQIHDKGEITLRGGYADCGTNTQTEPSTTIGGTLSVLNGDEDSDTRRSVRLQRLIFENGQGVGSAGGAISIFGRMLVVLDRTIVRNSEAEFGGGISVEGAGEDTALRLLAGSGVIGNDAIGSTTASGGGIFCFNALVELAHPQVSVLLNRSFGTDTNLGEGAGVGGGGIYLDSCRLESVAGGAFAGVSGNFSAARGGGIHAVKSSALIFRHLPGASTGPQVAGNGSDHEGGGISLHQSSLEARELAVFGNTALTPGDAGEGGGVVARQNSTVNWGRSLLEGSNCPAAQQSCNRLSDNEAATRGGGLSLIGSQGLIQQIEISGNRGGTNSAVSITGGDSHLDLEGALVTANTSTEPPASVILLRGGVAARLSHTTIADNPGHDRIIDMATTSGDALDLHSSVISEASDVAIVALAAGDEVTARCLMTHLSILGFDHASNTVRPHSHRAQLFLDPNAGDYRPNPLGAGQLLVDYCDGSFTTTSTDGLLTERGVDLPEVPDRTGPLSGPYDIGAYELGELPDITIFSDRFEQLLLPRL